MCMYIHIYIYIYIIPATRGAGPRGCPAAPLLGVLRAAPLLPVYRMLCYIMLCYNCVVIVYNVALYNCYVMLCYVMISSEPPRAFRVRVLYSL